MESPLFLSKLKQLSVKIQEGVSQMEFYKVVDAISSPSFGLAFPLL